MKNWPRWRNLTWATASQSHRICVADSSSSRHLSRMGSSVNPNLKRCPFRWQCPVSSPTTHLNWSLLSLNRSFVLLAEGPYDERKFGTHRETETATPVPTAKYIIAYVNAYLTCSRWPLLWMNPPHTTIVLIPSGSLCGLVDVASTLRYMQQIHVQSLFRVNCDCMTGTLTGWCTEAPPTSK
jgi:hypothetical protein